MKNFVHNILSLAFLIMLSACVGTVQDTKESFTKANDAPIYPMTFAGVTSVNAISDTRVEVFFFPASGGSGNYTYDIIVGNSPYPISVPSDVLTPDYRGLLHYTITGLTRLTNYQIKVEVREKGSVVPSNSGVIKNTSTYDKTVADFQGISSVTNMPGQDGKDSLRIRWTPARSSGSLTKQDWDPDIYEVVVVDAERLTPGDMDLNLTSADGRWVFQFNHDDTVNEKVLKGLPSNRRFFIRMRCLHWASMSDVYDPRKRSETNTRYVTINTLSDSLADIKFERDSFAVALATGEQGLSAVQASWTTAAGVFDHYRVYYGIQGNAGLGSLPDLCLSPLIAPANSSIFCKKADFNTSGTPITGLSPYSVYDMILVLCQTSSCGQNERISTEIRSVTTDPLFPSFNGLNSIANAATLVDIGSVYLKFDPPNFSQGFFDGIIVKMRRTTDGSDAEVEITNASNPVFLHSFNFLTQNSIKVSGLELLSTDPYCFTIYPFKWDVTGLIRREQPNGIWRCIQPLIEPPTATEFPGLKSATNIADRVSLTWLPPSNGIYGSYELFWRKLSPNFNWGEAIAQAANNFNYTNYGRMLLDEDQTSITIDGFATGEYTFGVLTYYNYVTEDGIITLRSETNNGTYKCVFDNASPEEFDCTAL